VFFHKNFLGPFAAKDPERATATSNKYNNKFIPKRQEVLANTKTGTGDLCIF
jgi:hypothetical protein